MTFEELGYVRKTAPGCPFPPLYAVDVVYHSGAIYSGRVAREVDWGLVEYYRHHNPDRETISVSPEQMAEYLIRTESKDRMLGRFSETVGDVNSNARGAGARYNAGKPDFSQFPLSLIVDAQDGVTPSNLARVLDLMTSFQHNKINHMAPSDKVLLLEALKNIPDALRSAARVFTYGEKKYARYNWMKGMAWNIPIACIGRHALAILEGEENDPESGESHYGHIACNIIMLLHFLEHYPEGDDRPCKPE
jgi:hypothetical protein